MEAKQEQLTAKQILLKAANDNPAACIVCYVVNGILRVEQTPMPIESFVFIRRLMDRKLNETEEAVFKTLVSCQPEGTAT